MFVDEDEFTFFISVGVFFRWLVPRDIIAVVQVLSHPLWALPCLLHMLLPHTRAHLEALHYTTQPSHHSSLATRVLHFDYAPAPLTITMGVCSSAFPAHVYHVARSGHKVALIIRIACEGSYRGVASPIRVVALLQHRPPGKRSPA